MQGDRVVVIGAGIGGLAAALRLALAGLDVTLVEKADSPGGKVRQVPVGGLPVDAGPTVFTLREVFEELFADAGARLDERIEARPADILARHAWSESERLDLFADPERSVDAVGAFAGAREARGYRAFAAEARRIYEALDRPFLRAGPTNPLGLGWRMGLRGLKDYATLRPYSSLWRALGGYFRDPRLRQLFGRYATYCGSSPFAAPATLMLIAHVEAKGVWLVEGGISALAEALADLCREQGITLRFGAEAADIAIERGRVAEVRLASGERLAADAIVCNADPAALAAGCFGVAAGRAVRSVPPKRRSLSAMTWMIAGRGEGFPLERHNVFFSADYPAEFAALANGGLADTPSIYVCALDRPAAEPGRERFQIIVNAPAIGDIHQFGPEEIEQCSERMHERLKACGLALTPSSPPVVATPNDFERLFPSTGGALYGRASHGWAASFLRQSARTKIPGLYCAGGSTHPGAGVPMAALSGRLAAACVMQDRASTARSRRAAMPGGMSTPSARTAASG